jgi:outer membrane protein
MRSVLRAATLALTLSVFAASDALAQGAYKLAHIDSRLILAQAPGRTRIDSVMEQKAAPMRRRLTVMQDSMQAMVAAFQKDEATLTPAVRQQRGEAIQKKQQAFQDEAERMQQSADSLRDALSRPIIETFNQVLNDIRNEDGYAYVFDIGSAAQAILAVDKNLDITDKVLARMRTAMAAKPNTAKPAPGPTAAPPTRVTPPPPAGR